MRKLSVVGVVILLVVLAVAISVQVPLRAENNVSKSDISERLDEISQQQKEILQKIDSLKEQLEDIRVSANRC